MMTVSDMFDYGLQQVCNFTFMGEMTLITVLFIYFFTFTITKGKKRRGRHNNLALKLLF